MSTDSNTAAKPGPSVSTLLYGVFVVLVVLLLAAGLLGGVGSVELTIWVLLVVAWVSFWMVKRRR